MINNVGSDHSILSTPIRFARCGKYAPNRFMKAPLTELMATWTPQNSDINGIPTEKIVNLYQKWSTGCFGLFITGNVIVDSHHLEAIGNMIIDANQMSCGECLRRQNAFRDILNAAKGDHGNGTIVIAQLNHAGSRTPKFINPNPFSPSDIQMKPELCSLPLDKSIPLTTEQVQTEVIDKFVYAARFLANQGYDGVELNATHGFLLSQFLSPKTNNRSDCYGGSVQNRFCILSEIVKAMRYVIPDDFIFGIKLNTLEFQANHLSVHEAALLCQAVANSGFDFMELTGGDMEKDAAAIYSRESTALRNDYFIRFIDAVSKIPHDTCPVYTTGGHRTVVGIVKAIESGLTQGIGIGRPITQEPNLTIKLLSGESIEARKILLDPFNFPLTKAASHTQMAQMAINPYSGNPNENIMDLSDQNVVNEYIKALNEHQKQISHFATNNQHFVDICQFSPGN